MAQPHVEPSNLSAASLTQWCDADRAKSFQASLFFLHGLGILLALEIQQAADMYKNRQTLRF